MVVQAKGMPSLIRPGPKIYHNDAYAQTHPCEDWIFENRKISYTVQQTLEL
jgi:hypothetical protein